MYKIILKIFLMLFSLYKLNFNLLPLIAYDYSAVNEYSYKPTNEEKIAYEQCINYIKDKQSSVLYNKSKSEQKKTFKDFMIDYKNDNCGTNETLSQKFQDKSGNIFLYDPFNKQQIYKGPNTINTSIEKKSKYEITLKMIQYKIQVINDFLLLDFKFTPWEKIETIINNLYQYKIDNKKTLKETIKELNNISSKIVIINSQTNLSSDNTYFKTIIFITLIFTFSTIFLYFQNWKLYTKNK